MSLAAAWRAPIDLLVQVVIIVYLSFASLAKTKLVLTIKVDTTKGLNGEMSINYIYVITVRSEPLGFTSLLSKKLETLLTTIITQ